jgi:hypothetical protein
MLHDLYVAVTYLAIAKIVGSLIQQGILEQSLFYFLQPEAPNN